MMSAPAFPPERVSGQANPPSHLLSEPPLLLRTAAGNSIQDEGAKAVAAALEPRKNPDGTWAFNPALQELDLSCEEPTPSSSSPSSPCLLPEMMSAPAFPPADDDDDERGKTSNEYQKRTREADGSLCSLNLPSGFRIPSHHHQKASGIGDRGREE